MSFRLDPQPWMESEHVAPEIRHTSALLRIEVDGKLVTHAEDTWSRSVTDRVRLSAWPLALWLAGNWWRLRWEPAPSERPPPDWRMAHQMVACGHGFLWPHLQFASDGERIEIRCEATLATERQPYGYLSSFVASISAPDFERAVDEFVETVIARLATFGYREGDLQSLWSAVREERSSPEQSEYRRIEAELGFDPDGAPVRLVNKLLRLRPQLGENAVREIAAVCSGPDAEERLSAVLGVEKAATVEGRVELPKLGAPPADLHPWERGRILALDLRSALGLGTSPVSSLRIAELLGVEGSKLDDDPGVRRLPIGLAIRQGEDVFKYAFRKRPASGRRFEAARWISEALSAPGSQRWLTTTDTGTAQQKFQRAFAAEFLAPIAGMRDYLKSDYSDAAIEDASDHFQVSPLAIRSHLANHGEIAREQVGPAQ